MGRMMVLIFLVGCQEYSIQPPPGNLDLPALPPDVPVEVTPDPPPLEEPALAEYPVYANTRDALYQVDPATGERTLIGHFHFADGDALMDELEGNDGMTDIAIDSDGRLFGGTYGSLWRIDAETAEVEFVCDMRSDRQRQMYAMAFTPNDELIASGDDGTISRIETNNCETTVVLQSSIYETAGDLVGLPDGYIYWTVEEGDDYDANGLVRVDPNSWYVQYLGTIPVARLYGLSYSDGQLYGFSGSLSGQSKIIAIEPPGAPPADGMVTTWTIDDDGEIGGWWGATTNPVLWED